VADRSSAGKNYREPALTPDRSGPIECPHCHNKIIARADGTCPACHGDTFAAGDGRALVSIGPQTRLPQVCAECGGATKRTVSLEFKQDGPESRLAWFLAHLPRPFGTLFTLQNADGQFGQSFSVRLPHCKACDTKSGTPEPTHVSFDDWLVQFSVHPNLRDALADLDDEA
jgi:hypothetical protein